MEIISFVILGMIVVSVASYCAGKRHSANEYEITKANLECKQAELKNLKMAYDLQSKKYDSLYDAFLRMNKYNKDLSIKLQGRVSRSYEDLADKMYEDYILGMSRHEISDKYKISYSTTCFWLRKKSKEMKNVKFNAHEKPLLV